VNYLRARDIVRLDIVHHGRNGGQLGFRLFRLRGKVVQAAARLEVNLELWPFELFYEFEKNPRLRQILNAPVYFGVFSMIWRMRVPIP